MRFTTTAVVATALAATLLATGLWLNLIGPDATHATPTTTTERAADLPVPPDHDRKNAADRIPATASADHTDPLQQERMLACRDYRALRDGQKLLVGVSDQSLDTLARQLPGAGWSREDMRELLALNLGIERIFSRGLTHFFQGGTRHNSDPYAYLSEQDLESRARAGDPDAHFRLGTQRLGALFTNPNGLHSKVWPEYRAALALLEQAAYAGNTDALIDLMQTLERAPHTAREQLATLEPEMLQQLQTDFYRWHLYATEHPDLTVRMLGHFSMDDLEQYKDERFRILFSKSARQLPAVMAARNTLTDLPRASREELLRTEELKARLGDAEQALEILTTLEGSCPETAKSH